MKINATVSIMEVTPLLASEWLQDKWGEQRNLKKGNVERLVSDMLAGRFKTGPDAILRIKGKLANGQHRLQAVIESGKKQQFIVMVSNDEELYKIVDCGCKRTVADAFVGRPYGGFISAVARWVYAHENRTLHTGVAEGSRYLHRDGRRYLTQSELSNTAKQTWSRSNWPPNLYVPNTRRTPF